MIHIISKPAVIEESRVRAGLSRRRLSLIAGIDPATVCKLENGERHVTPATAKAVAEALNREMTELFTLSTEVKR